MWLYLAVLLGLYYLLHWYQERSPGGKPPSGQGRLHHGLTDLGFGNLLARQLDLGGLRVLAVCLTGQGPEQLRNRRQTGCRQWSWMSQGRSESITGATGGWRGCKGTEVPPRFLVYFFSVCERTLVVSSLGSILRFFHDLKSHLPSSPSPGDQPKLFHHHPPRPTSWPWGTIVWGRDFPDKTASLQITCLVSPLSQQRVWVSCCCVWAGVIG